MATLRLLIGKKFIFTLNFLKLNFFIACSIWMIKLEKNSANYFFSRVVLSLKLQQPIIAAFTKLCWYYVRFAKDVLY